MATTAANGEYACALASELTTRKLAPRVRKQRRMETGMNEKYCEDETQQNENEDNDDRQYLKSRDYTKVELQTLEIKEICSVEFFRSTPLAEFRRRCKDCLVCNVLLSSRKTLPMAASSTLNDVKLSENDNSCDIVRYDHSEIIRRLTNDFDWKSLCEHHDKCEYIRRNNISNTSTKTPLGEIVLMLTNPMVIPRCCHQKCLIDVLLNALLMSPSLSLSLKRRRSNNYEQYTSTAATTTTMSRWTPSQHFLLETIRRLIFSEWMPPDSPMTDYVRRFVLTRPLFHATVDRGATAASMANTNTMTPNKVNRLLSAIYWLLSSSLSLSSFSLFMERELVSSGLLLLQRIDSWNIHFDKESHQKPICGEGNISTCVVCGGDISTKPNAQKSGLHRSINKKMTVETLSNLHDDAIDAENETTRIMYHNNKMLRRRWSGLNQRQVSLKDVLTMKRTEKSGNNSKSLTKTCRCMKNGNGNSRYMERVGETDHTAILNDWSTVLSRAYKKFMSYTVGRRRQQHMRELSSYDFIEHLGIKSMPMVQNSEKSFLWWLVSEVATNQESASRRVCLVLLAHSTGGPNNPSSFMHVSSLFWQGYLLSSRKQKSSSSCWLRVYSEWLSECAVFDQRAIAWEAIQPILQHITARLVSLEKEQNGSGIESCSFSTQKPSIDSNMPLARESYDSRADHDVHEDIHVVDPPLMACLSYILHRRSHLFESHEADEERIQHDDNNNVPKLNIGNDFRSFINLLSIFCGESPEPWLSLFSNATRDLVESTLQRLGVLSFSVSDAKKELNNHIATSSIHGDLSICTVATSNWPFCKEFGLRKAMGRIDYAVLSLEHGNDIVKSLLTHPANSRQTVKSKTKRVRKTHKYSVPLTNFLHDNGILCLIFSFCGPKRLAKIPQVCKAWKDASETVSNTLWENAYRTNFGRYRWPCVDSERCFIVATSPTAATALDTSPKKREMMSETYWRNLFTQKFIAEKMVRFQRNPRTGYKHRTCNYVGCLHILKTAEQERKHEQMHRRLLSKQQAASKKKTSSKRKDKDRNKVDNTRDG